MEAIISLLSAGGLITVAGFSVATYMAVGKHKDSEAVLRAKIYTKFDAERDKADEAYVKKDVCKILHQQVKDDLNEIKIDVKKLLTKRGI